MKEGGVLKQKIFISKMRENKVKKSTRNQIAHPILTNVTSIAFEKHTLIEMYCKGTCVLTYFDNHDMK